MALADFYIRITLTYSARGGGAASPSSWTLNSISSTRLSPNRYQVRGEVPSNRRRILIEVRLHLDLLFRLHPVSAAYL